MKQFDLFVSYTSQDASVAERLCADLKKRDLRIWDDGERTLPGDLFPGVLPEGFATSRALGLIATPEGIASKWVATEYQRIASLADQTDLPVIPLLFGGAERPALFGGLSCVYFRDADSYECDVDQVIWPGCTRKQVIFVGVHPGRRAPWPAFRRKLDDLGIRFVQGENVNRARFHIGQITKTGSHRIVVVLDIFEDWPEYRWPRRNSPEQYVDFILDVRNKTRGTSNEVVILLLHHSDAFQNVHHSLDDRRLQRLRHYCSLPGELEGTVLAERLRTTWNRLQAELLEAERVVPADEPDPAAPSSRQLVPE